MKVSLDQLVQYWRGKENTTEYMWLLEENMQIMWD